MTLPDTHTFAQQLYKDGVILDPQARLEPLTGGVSSEIYHVTDGARQFVVKRALAKLNVAAEWYADTSRNVMEQAYLGYVGRVLPLAVPKLIHASVEDDYFAMEFLEGFTNWKADLLAGQFDVALAGEAGRILGKIHAASWNDPIVVTQFDAIENFDQLRIDPYLRATAKRHPTLAPQLLAEADRLRQSRQCLMHGDYSPKNMLHHEGRLVILDCEVACHGDAAFDLAFLLNHLLLKGMFHAPKETDLPKLFEAVMTSYANEVGGLSAQTFKSAARLLPMLLLARVDGKSPVEYLGATEQQNVRQFAIVHVQTPPEDLSTLASQWYTHL